MTTLHRVQWEWVTGALAATAARANSVAEHLRRYGYIATTGATTPQEELLALLRLAAEVEHALLVQYLYAAASIDNSAQTQRKILNVAIQEMAHFITVQNLLLAVGGPAAFHIGRDLFRAGSSLNPLPLNRAPLSRLTLAEYVLAEMPSSFPPQKTAVEARVAALQVEVAKQAGLSPHRVGALYARIYWLLQPTDAAFGPTALEPDPAIGLDPGWHIPASAFSPAATVTNHQADPVEWRYSSGPDLRIHLVTDALSAVQAVHSVMEQGEGLGHAEDSHFYEFLETLDLFEAGSVPVRPLPTNPYVGSLPAGVATGVPLQHPYARLWANLFNVRYTGLLTDIGHALATPRTDPDRAILVSLAFDQMMPRLNGLTTQMFSPYLIGLDPASAPTFELLREDLPATAHDLWLRQSALLNLEAPIRTALRARPELAQDAAGGVLLDDLEANWQERRGYVDAHLAP